jgi:1-acyl-sn-glycerol-3-phosphate acyltransferase
MDGAAPPETRAHRSRGAHALQRPSAAWLRFFALYLRRYMPRHFHALRLAHAERWPRGVRPLIICVNHPSWWDPMVCIELSRLLEPAAAHYAPIDAEALARYGVLRKLGLFAVEQGTLRGAAQFLHTAQAVLGRPEGVLWLTPQGGFVDVRVRPVVFRPGLDALLRRLDEVTVVPLALEYTYWNERLPEALAMLGEPLTFMHGALLDEDEEKAPGKRVAEAMARTQDALAALAQQRDADGFTALFAGRQGTGGVYGWWQRFRSARRGEGLFPEHGTRGAARRNER